MSSLPYEAKELGASDTVLINLEAAVSRILSAHWDEHDCGGTVAWKK